MAKAKATPWANRITRYGEEAPDQLLANPRNSFKIHPKAQQEAMVGTLNDLGWLAPVIVSERSGYVVDGHMRVSVAIAKGEASVPVAYVDISEGEEAEALATFDPLGAMVAYDKQELDALLHEVQSGEEAVVKMLADLAKEAGLEYGESKEESYSRKIEAPIYEPNNVKPPVTALFDDSRTKALVAAIEAAEGLTDEERRFLMIAAQRHTVLHFNKIADYYAHADAGLQALMEDSALIIIDFDRAIELGFVTLTKKIAEQVRDEYGE